MKNIIVVTGASYGMGKEFLLQIEKKEAVDEIWAIARSRDLLEELQDQVHTPVVPLVLDLTDDASFRIYQDKLSEEKPSIRVLANCAGFGIFDHSENIDPEVQLNMIDLNCRAYTAMCAYSLPYMEKGGKIMNIASCAGFQPIPYINLYAATKAFVLSYTRALNQELRYKNIHALSVCPFWTATRFFDRAIDKSKKEVVINYAAMYDPAKVMKKAIKDLYTKKEISCFGFVNQSQHILVRLLPKRMVMSTWMKQQKLDGTPGIR